MDELAQRIAKLSPQKRALLELQLLKKKGLPEPIAIVGIGCRFPGAPNRAGFWQLLQAGTDAITPVPRDRWDADSLYDKSVAAPGKTYCREGGFLNQVDHFDPTFFGIAPREATFVDPQQRLFLEVAWEALEDAGIPAPQLSGTQTGVFVGISTNDYGQWLLAGPETVGTYTTTGLASTMVANRLSYLLNLRGPSLAIDTACSSSLVAVHLACQSLRSGESAVAIAGGVNLILRPELTIGFSKLTALSPDGRCKAFDAAANGFVRSEGAGAVVLKPLSQAIQAGDPLYAVIRGSAVNQDGRSNGLTAPNREAQEAVIQAAFDQAGLSPQQVDYIEAHGTGTLLGDPIEAKALGRVLGTALGDRPVIPMGSVKSNIGHTEAAAGIASLIKVALCIKHATLVPSLHFHTPNPHIPFDEMPLRVQQHCEPWPMRGGKHTAGVSAFAFGGTNAHAVLQSPPDIAPQPQTVKRPHHLLTLSAKTPLALKAQVTQFANWLEQSTDALADVCATVNQGRSHFTHRLAVSGVTSTEMVKALRAASRQASHTLSTTSSTGQATAVVFLFTGQGAQYEGMGQRLYDTQPVFRETVDRCAELVAPYLDTPLKPVLFSESLSDSLIHQTAYTQPALFVLEYALATLWQSWGIQPAAVLGHSVGEYVAACIAGVLSLEDGLRLITQRGRLMQSLPEAGTMAAVFADEATVNTTLATIDDTVAIATLNGPANTVIAGTQTGVAAALDGFKTQGIRVQALQVSHAFHSPLMDPILPVFAHLAGQVQYHPAQIPLALNVTGTLLARGESLDAAYWQQHARQPVQFAAGLQALYQAGFRTFLEIGPHPVLCGMGRRCLMDTDVHWLPTLQRGRSDWVGLLTALGRLYEQGHPVDWGAFDRPYSYQRVHGLPTYPFQRQRCWADIPDEILPFKFSTGQPVAALPECFYEIIWETTLLPSFSPENCAAYRWLIFTDQQGGGTALTNQLIREKARVTVVHQAHTTQLQGYPRYQLNPAEPEAFAQLLSQVLARATTVPSRPLQILYLWGLDQSSEDPHDVATSGAGLLHLIQALAAYRPKAAARVWIMTRNTLLIPSSGATPSPMQAPLWGIGSVIALEHPDLWGGLVDLEKSTSWPETLTETLLGHFTQGDTEDRVAFRGGKRWGARLRPLPVSPSQPAPAMRKDGTYLITGGLGALGLRVAQSLVGLGAKTLVLVSRRGAQPAQQSTLAAMRQSGATVHVESVDVAEARAVSGLIQMIQETLPPLRGIVHAAGNLADGLLVSQTWQQFQTVMAAKIQGAWNLHRAVKANPLDFFLLFSSAASLLGSPGQSNYAAANAFLDALAYTRRSQGLAAQTLNWGPWQGSGLATQSGDIAQRLAVRGIKSFPPEKGIRLFEHILGWGKQLPPQIGILQADWGLMVSQLPAKLRPAFFSQLAPKELPVQGTRNYQEELLTLDMEARTGQIQTYLQAEMAQVLGRSDAVSSTANLLDMGLDSLMVMDLVGICQRDLGLTLYPREIFEHPTLEQLSRYLAQELARMVQPAASTATVTAPLHDPPEETDLTFPIWGRTRTFEPISQKNPSAVFLLSSPRSGSTLLRVMLAGHPHLFCPPELHLLPFETLAEREAALADSYLDQGLQRAIMALKDLDAETSAALLTDWGAQGVTIAEAYRKLQSLAENRYLVDKSPTYGFSLSTLQRAEQLFENARYVYLTRHPYAVVDSFVRNRMDKIFDLPNREPYALANQAWTVSNQNILAFLSTVPSDRQHRVSFEELVTHPKAVMEALCEFLGIAFHPLMTDPYQSSGQRMTDGVKAQSLPIDDPNFHRRRAIEPALADTWKTVTLPVPLAPAGQTLALKLGYALPAVVVGEQPAVNLTVAPLSTLQERRLTLRGVDLCICTWGPDSGMPVLCLHGVLNQGAIWDAIAPALVAQGYRVIAPDLRGHGKSAHIGPAGNYQLLDHVGDVDALVHQLGLEAIHLVGHSMGAVIAAALTSARPHLVRSLTLIEPVVPGAETASSADQLTTHLQYLANPPTHPIYSSLSEAVERFKTSIPGLSSDWAKPLTARIIQTTEDGVQWRWDPRLQVRTRFGLSGGTFTRDRYGQLLQTIRAPAALIFGQQSGFNRPEDLAFQRQHLPHAAVVKIPGGHHLPLESPVEVAGELLCRLQAAVS